MEKLRMNIDFDNSSLDFLGSRKLCTKVSKSDTPVNVVILPLLASLSWKQLQIGMGNGHAAYNKH